jgi:Tfp pilus assembly protein PilN
VRSLTGSIRELRDSKYALEGNLDELRTEIDTLTKFEKRKAALQEVEDTYEDIASFLGKV